MKDSSTGFIGTGVFVSNILFQYTLVVLSSACSTGFDPPQVAAWKSK